MFDLAFSDFATFTISKNVHLSTKHIFFLESILCFSTRITSCFSQLSQCRGKKARGWTWDSEKLGMSSISFFFDYTILDNPQSTLCLNLFIYKIEVIVPAQNFSQWVLTKIKNCDGKKIREKPLVNCKALQKCKELLFLHPHRFVFASVIFFHWKFSFFSPKFVCFFADFLTDFHFILHLISSWSLCRKLISTFKSLMNWFLFVSTFCIFFGTRIHVL